MGRVAWVVGMADWAQNLSLTRFPISNISIWFYYLEPVLRWPILGAEKVGTKFRYMSLARA